MNTISGNLFLGKHCSSYLQKHILCIVENLLGEDAIIRIKVYMLYQNQLHFLSLLMNNKHISCETQEGSEKFKMEFYSTAVGKSFGKGKWQGNIGLHTGLLPPSKLSLWSLKNNQYRAGCSYTK